MYKLLFYSSKALGSDRKKLLKDNKSMALIQKALGELAVNPLGKTGIKKLENSSEATYRLRCGPWRILFDVDHGNRQIVIYRIKQRKEGYE